MGPYKPYVAEWRYRSKLDTTITVPSFSFKLCESTEIPGKNSIEGT